MVRGIVSTDNQSTWSNLDTCGGPRMRSTRAKASADWKALSDIATMEFYRSNQEFDAETILWFWEYLGSGTDHCYNWKKLKLLQNLQI